MNKQFTTLVQKRVASTSIGASTARGMGPKRTIEKTRDFLMNLDLRVFTKARNQTSFEELLNKTTDKLSRSLPRGGQHWGSSRKFLNIFLRGALYNRYLYKAYRLRKLEPWLEVPLDRDVANGLRSEPGGKALPRWKTVIGLDQETSKLYQNFASNIARGKNIGRVHLDLWYWRNLGKKG